MSAGPNGSMISKCYGNLRSKFANSVINWICITKVTCRFRCVCSFSKIDKGWGFSSGGRVLA